MNEECAQLPHARNANGDPMSRVRIKIAAQKEDPRNHACRKRTEKPQQRVASGSVANGIPRESAGYRRGPFGEERCEIRVVAK